MVPLALSIISHSRLFSLLGHHGGGHGGHDGKAGQPSGFFVRGYFIPWDSIKALFIIVVLLFAAILFASVKVDDPSERMHNIVVWSHKSTCMRLR